MTDFADTVGIIRLLDREQASSELEIYVEDCIEFTNINNSKVLASRQFLPNGPEPYYETVFVIKETGTTVRFLGKSMYIDEMLFVCEMLTDNLEHCGVLLDVFD